MLFFNIYPMLIFFNIGVVFPATKQNQRETLQNFILENTLGSASKRNFSCECTAVMEQLYSVGISEVKLL